jgi:hypothetical protein
MRPAVDIWWTQGAPAEPATAPVVASRMSSVPAEWRRGLRGRFLQDIARQYSRGLRNWNAKGAAGGWRFNLSAGQHLSLTDSGSCLIVAVGRGTPIGIDAERIRPVDDAMATLAKLGLKQHVAVLTRLPPAARQRAFAHIWTAFEAFLKLERLPWDTAAARFAVVQDQWRFATDGTASFLGQTRMGLVFSPVNEIPGILLTLASPVACGITVQNWRCDPIAMPTDKLPPSAIRELRRAEKQ